MKKTIDMSEVPFDFLMKQRLTEKNAVVEVSENEIADYYYFTTDTYHACYSYGQHYRDGEPLKITEISLFDLYEALEYPIFRDKVQKYIGVVATSPF